MANARRHTTFKKLWKQAADKEKTFLQTKMAAKKNCGNRQKTRQGSWGPCDRLGPPEKQGPCDYQEPQWQSVIISDPSE